MAEVNSMVRVGRVSSVNLGAKQCRVFFPDQGNMVSDWLPVLQRPMESVEIKPAEEHVHKAYVTWWMPEVNDRVVVVYPYGWNTNGFVLGAIP